MKAVVIFAVTALAIVLFALGIAVGQMVHLNFITPEQFAKILAAFSGYAWPIAAVVLAFMVRGPLRRFLSEADTLDLKLPWGRVRIKRSQIRDIQKKAARLTAKDLEARSAIQRRRTARMVAVVTPKPASDAAIEPAASSPQGTQRPTQRRKSSKRPSAKPADPSDS